MLLKVPATSLGECETETGGIREGGLAGSSDKVGNRRRTTYVLSGNKLPNAYAYAIQQNAFHIKAATARNLTSWMV